MSCREIYPDCDMQRWEVEPTSYIADADNYYTKTEVDNKIDEIVISGGGVSSGEVEDMISDSISGKADSSAVTEEISAAVSGKVDTTDFATYSGTVETALSGKANSSAVTEEISAAVSGKADTTAVTESINAATSGLQETLVSGSNIKTINNLSILGEGNIEIQGGGTITIDPALDSGSTNAVANSAITEAINEKLDASAYTPTDLSNYDTKNEVNNKISSATGLVYNSLTAHTADSQVHVTSAQTSAWDAKSNFSGSYTDLTDKPTIPQIWQGTLNQYNAIVNKDANTIYLIYEE